METQYSKYKVCKPALFSQCQDLCFSEQESSLSLLEESIPVELEQKDVQAILRPLNPISDHDDSQKKTLFVFNDNRIITKNINSGNTNHKHILDSYNDNSNIHRAVNWESNGM